MMRSLTARGLLRSSWPRRSSAVWLVLFVAVGCDPQGRSLEERRAAAKRIVAAMDDQSRARPEPQSEVSRPGAQTPTSGFEKFQLVAKEAPCPTQANGDCDGAVLLEANGMLSMDPWGLPQLPSFAARVADEAVANVVPVLTDPALLELMGRKPVCQGANGSETMSLRMGGRALVAITGGCNQEPIQAVRRALQSLTDAHFAGRTWFSPPF